MMTVEEFERSCAEMGCPHCNPSPPWTNLDFGQALAAMRVGKRVRRAEWKIAWVIGTQTGEIMEWHGDLDSGFGLARGRSVRVDDILARDWEIVD